MIENAAFFLVFNLAWLTSFLNYFRPFYSVLLNFMEYAHQMSPRKIWCKFGYQNHHML